MKKIYGIYVNDANYPTQWTEEGNRVLCPFFKTWKGMISRCSAPSVIKSRPTYIDVEVEQSWHYFMTFKGWMEKQEWKGLSLDKDILSFGDKLYSAENCAFVPDYINNLLISRQNDRGLYPLGVTKIRDVRMVNELKKAYSAGISSKYLKRYLGVFATPMEAHREWQKAKMFTIAKSLEEYRNEKFFNPRVEQALMARLAAISEDFNNQKETFKI